MSWKARGQYYRQLENMIEDGLITIEELLKDDGFLNALGQQLPELSKFVAKHVKFLLEVAIELAPAPKCVNSFKCMLALISHNSRVSDALTKDETIVNIITDAVTKKIQLARYFRILQFAIDTSSGEILTLIEKPYIFFRTLIDMIDSSPVFQFLTTLFVRHYQPIINWLDNAHADEILIEMLTREDEIVVNALKLISGIFIIQSDTPLAEKLASFKNFKQILETGLEAPTATSAELAFRVAMSIAQLYDLNSDDSSSYERDKIKDSKSNGSAECLADQKKLQGRQIIHLLGESVEKLCEVVMRDKEYAGDKHWALSLIRLGIESRKNIGPVAMETAGFLFDLFFELTTNDFLHRGFMDLFKAMINIDGWKDFISTSNVVNRLMDAYKQRKEKFLLYGGFIINIADCIREKSEKEKIDFGDEWNEFIKENVPFVETTAAPTTKFEGPKIEIEEEEVLELVSTSSNEESEEDM